MVTLSQSARASHRRLCHRRGSLSGTERGARPAGNIIYTFTTMQPSSLQGG